MIRAPDRRHLIHCTIEDRSAAGAKLICKEAAGLPDAFELSTSAGPFVRCEVIWRDATTLGVKFVDTTSP